MKGKKEFKKIIKEDEKLRKKFLLAESQDDAFKIAKQEGFLINKSEALNDEELMDDMLDLVAGGKGKTGRVRTFNVDAEGWTGKIDPRTGKIL